VQISPVLKNQNKPKEDKGKNKKSIVAQNFGYAVWPDIVFIKTPERL
jgi:carbamoylphosphate synthase small subunit